MEAADRTREAIRRIVERTDLDRFTDGILDSFWDRPEYRRFRPPREDVREWVRWNVDLVVRWLVDDQPPTQADLERFRERARGLARDGMPADVVPANFRHGARYAWTSLLEAAREDERPALLESADLLFEFVDRVSHLFSDTYESTRPPAVVSDDERRALGLLDRVCSGAALVGEDYQLAERLGFDLNARYRPFALSAPSLSVQHHADAGRPPPRRASAGHLGGTSCRGRGVAPSFAWASWTSSPTGPSPRRGPRRARFCRRPSTSSGRSWTWPRRGGAPGRCSWTTICPSS